ncbi:MAG: hypothetical protein H8D45_06015 [Bacteroidetes bacterium]|nr:hypothetical protein [Bacteroidota bacterium]MBL7104019.1 hypothetical protein [Bacteroidales bacterium]
MKNLFITFSVLIAISFTTISQEVVCKNLKENKGGSNSSIMIKSEIPNFDQSLTTNPTNNQSLKSDITLGNFNDKGSERMVSRDYLFIEREDKAGFPVGWITNSEFPIINYSDNSNFLSLNSNQSDIYIGKLVTVNQQISGIKLSFHNLSTVKLTITKIFSNGSSNSQSEFILPSGKYKDYIIDLEQEPDLSNLLLKFEKNGIGEFKLFEIKMMED